MPTQLDQDLIASPADAANWVTNMNVLWDFRVLLGRVALLALLVGGCISFALPKQYESTARLMPPEGGSANSAVLAAVLGRSAGTGALGSLAGDLLDTHGSGVLFLDLLRSRAVADRLIDRFDLQHLYRKHYRIDTVKYLARHTKASEDKKSGVLELTYTDTDPRRARDIAQAYVQELDRLLTQSSTSSARREREFIEQRLVGSEAELQAAQRDLSEFSSTNSTLDIKEQTHATVDAAAKLEGEKIVAESELASLEQIYGDQNVRVRAARARISDLKKELDKMSGTSAPLKDGRSSDTGNLYPSIRQLPRLAVPYANLYRRVRIQETVFELLSQQFEVARIEEAKDTPVVREFDAPLIAERKSFPPRLLLTLGFTIASILFAAILVLLRQGWRQLAATDPRKLLIQRIFDTFRFGARA